MNTAVDISEEPFDELIVIKMLPGRKCLCRCKCGSTTVKWTSNVTTGRSKSCGCDRAAAIGNSNRTHGDTESTEYKSWCGMIERCYNPNHKKFYLWGGRGISVCGRWRHSYENFLADVGRKPSPSHSIDRYPNTDGNYEPGNTRWANPKEQARNRRRQRFVTCDGITLTASEWAEKKGIDVRRLIERLNRGWSPESALNDHPETDSERSARVSLQNRERWSKKEIGQNA